jgi:hypothetical protein
MNQKNITQDYVKSRLDYDPKTGLFLWKYCAGLSKTFITRYIGGRAGYYRKINSYLVIRLNKANFLGHRLAWLFVYGEFPESNIDHIDGDPTNNRIANLRLATQSQNLMNSNLRSDNTTGIKGTTKSKASGKFLVSIKVKNQTYRLGVFNNFVDAAEARRLGEIKYHGSFARGAQS